MIEGNINRTTKYYKGQDAELPYNKLILIMYM